MSDSGSPIAGLAFLAGRWRGEGTWGDRPFVCRTDVRWLLGRYLQIDVQAHQDGRPPHAERVVVHGDGDRLAATLYPDRGDVQHFDVLELTAGDAYRLVFTPTAGAETAPQRWTIRRTETGYTEVFEIAPGGGTYQTSVTCIYVPETDV